MKMQAIMLIWSSADVIAELNVLAEVSGSCAYYVGGPH